MAREDLHFRLRIPEELKAKVAEAAEANNRSMTAEIVHRLAMSFPNPELDRLARTQMLKSKEREMEAQLHYMGTILEDVREQLAKLSKNEDEPPASGSGNPTRDEEMPSGPRMPRATRGPTRH